MADQMSERLIQDKFKHWSDLLKAMEEAHQKEMDNIRKELENRRTDIVNLYASDTAIGKDIATAEDKLQIEFDAKIESINRRLTKFEENLGGRISDLNESVVRQDERFKSSIRMQNLIITVITVGITVLSFCAEHYRGYENGFFEKQ